MRELEYQARMLDTLNEYLDALKTQKVKADQIVALAKENPDLGLTPPDFAEKTWDELKAAGKLPHSRANIPFSERIDGIGRPVPNITLKVPTGGGKTFLAVNAVSRVMGRYLNKSTGFVLWIVPNEAIYTQTLKRLKDRTHPYRQTLDRAAALAATIPENAQAAVSQIQRIHLTDDDKQAIEAEKIESHVTSSAFDPAYAVRILSDLLPNPFVAREIVEDCLTTFKGRGFTPEKIAALGALIIEELRKSLDQERTTLAEVLFKSFVATGQIQFRLRIDGRNWVMPFEMETTEPETARQIARKDGTPLDKSLFAPVYEAELNGEEQDVAVYLDADEALVWWHRNVARAQYGLQGWKRSRIYPDFIFAATENNGSRQITVLETKGDQLDNADTAYKREFLSVLSDNFAWDNTTASGELELVSNTGETISCTLILMSEWKAKLPKYLQG